MDAWPVTWDGKEVGVYDIHLDGNKQLLIFDRADHINLLSKDTEGEIIMSDRAYTPEEFIIRMRGAGAGWNSFESVKAKKNYEKARGFHHRADFERHEPGRIEYCMTGYHFYLKLAFLQEVASPFVDAFDVASGVARSFIDESWRRDSKELS